MAMDEDSRGIVEYLRGLPQGAVVRWSTHHLSPDRPWTSRWVDVRIDGTPLKMSWMWTILGEDDKDGPSPDQLWDFVWPYDLEVHEVWNPVKRPKVFGEMVGTWAVPRGDPAPPEVAAALREAPEGAERGHVVLGGWSLRALTDAITRWTAVHAGRSDLRFEWDPDAEPPPAVARAAERAREIDEGGPTWDLGEGLVVADGMMDDLLAMDPDERDELIQAFRELG